MFGLPRVTCSAVKMLHSNSRLVVQRFELSPERFAVRDVEWGEVASGAVIKHALDCDLARETMLSSGLASTTPGVTIARARGASPDNRIMVADADTPEMRLMYDTRLCKRLLAMKCAKVALDKVKVALHGSSLHKLKPMFPGVGKPRGGKSMAEHRQQMAKQ